MNTRYGLEGWDTLEESVEDVVLRIFDESHDEDRPQCWPVEVIEFRPMAIPSADKIAELAVERVLELLDDLHSDPDADATKPTPAMMAAAKALGEVIVREYQSYWCEPTGKTVTVTREQALEMVSPNTQPK